MKNISLKNYGEKETQELVNTPRSLEACFREGIRPEDLLYAPFEELAKPGISKAIQQINFDFLETQRLKLLKLAKAQYSKLLVQKKRRKSHSELKIGKIVDYEIRKLREKNLKHVSKLVEFKLENIKSALEIEKSTEKNLASTTSNMADTRELKGSSRLNKSAGSLKNPRRDESKNKFIETLISKEQRDQRRFEEFEKQRLLEIESRRKLANMKLQEHLKRVRDQRERENQQTLNKIFTRQVKSEKQLFEIQEIKNNQKLEKLSKSKNRLSNAIALKQKVEEYHQKNREKIISEENSRISSHYARKQQLQNEFTERIHLKNLNHDQKSKNSRDLILKKIEERKEKMKNELKKRESQFSYLKTEKEKNQEIIKQKNKLRDVEKDWNYQRLARKEEFWRNEIMSGIKSDLNRVNEIKSAREFMQNFRHDFNMKAEAKKAKINDILYRMEVQKKFAVDEIQEVLWEDPIKIADSDEN